MKRVLNVAIAGKSFVIDEDAYSKLNAYLAKFKNSVKLGYQVKEVMDDLEGRIAELFTEKISAYKDVISMELVNSVIAQLGMPNGDPFVDEKNDAKKKEEENCSIGFDYTRERYGENVKRLFRNPYEKFLGGVCSGLAIYLGTDTALIRVLFIIFFFLGSAGFWIYLILWLVIPLANTAVQKCQMFGMPVTAENIKKFNLV